MRLLHIFPSFQVGGSQRRFAALANHFASNTFASNTFTSERRPFVHEVITLDGCRDAAALLDPAVRCSFVDAGPKTHTLATLFKARRILRDCAPDVLVTYNWGAVEWAAVNDGSLRHIHIEDGFGPEEAHKQLRRRAWFRRLVLNRFSTLVLPSQTLVGIALNQWRIAPARVLYLPNGIPCARFQNVAVRIPFRGAGPVIGTVAALRKEKALDRLLAAFAELRATRALRLAIVGDGAERQKLEQMAHDRGIADSVTFTGALARPEQAMAGFDIFAMSSDTEQMPLSLLEAMAAALPVAATDAGDTANLVAEENRPFIVPKDPRSLAYAIGTLLDNDALRSRLGAANRAKALASFDEGRMFSAYERLFSGTPAQPAVQHPLPVAAGQAARR